MLRVGQSGTQTSSVCVQAGGCVVCGLCTCLCECEGLSGSRGVGEGVSRYRGARRCGIVGLGTQVWEVCTGMGQRQMGPRVGVWVHHLYVVEGGQM